MYTVKKIPIVKRPGSLKIAKVKLVFKVGGSINQGNYMPISMLPVFSKVLKRIIYNKIRNHCTINNLLFLKKSGFQANHLIHHTILSLVNDITKPFQISELSLGISVGLSKAFNTAKHNILLTKLHNFGIKENCLKLLKSYLANIN